MRKAIRYVSAPAFAASLCLAAGAAMAGSTAADTFNRAKLGDGWTVPTGTLAITNDQLTGSTGAIGFLKAGKSSPSGSVTVYTTSTDLEYGALTIGDVQTGTNAFVKIQAQDGSGMFDTAAFYTGNNGSGNFFALTSPVPSPAQMDVAFCGTTAVLRITSAAGVQTYSNDYGASVGHGVGLGTYGAVALDNLIGYKGNCKGLDQAIPVQRLKPARDLSLKK